MRCYIACMTIALASASASIASAALPALRADGTRIVGPDGKPVVLRGCNLGNWLMIEPWMLGGCIEARDQGQITDILKQRFGDDRGYGLMELYREHYITPRDFELIKKFNFNVVRVPFDFRLLQDENPPYAMRADAFKWLDRAIELAEGAGIYVILDLHGVPQGQSNQMHTGRSDQPELWKDAAAQQRMIDLWVKIAQRFKDRASIAAYDVVNEPYADYKTDVTSTLRELMFRAFEAIRSTGDRHVILFPGALGQGVFFYGDLRARGYDQFAFTDHYYPGLFGSPSTLASHAHTIQKQFPAVQEYLDAQRAPFLAGEFNTVLDRCGGELMMRRYYDEFASRGWMATMWSYKLLKRSGGVEPDNWYAVTNAEPLDAIDIRNDDAAKIEAFMQSLSTMPLVADEPLRSALTDPNFKPIELPDLPDLPKDLPQSKVPTGWTATAVGASGRGAVVERDGKLVVTAAGSDVFGTSDSFYFVHQGAIDDGPMLLTARVESLLESGAYAKAGVMLRFGSPDETSAACVMLNVFPDGTVALLRRDEPGATALESKRFPGPLPRRIGLLREATRVVGLVADSDGAWVDLGVVDLSPQLSSTASHVGLSVSSNQRKALTRAEFADLRVARSADGLPRELRKHFTAQSPAPTNLLTRTGAGWNTWGAMARSQADADWRMSSDNGDAGLWKDVEAVTGKSYEFGIRASRDGAAGRDSGSVELRIEAPLPDGRLVALASSDFDVRWLEDGAAGGCSTLAVRAKAISTKLRVLVRINRPNRQDKPTSPVTVNLMQPQLIAR